VINQDFNAKLKKDQSFPNCINKSLKYSWFHYLDSKMLECAQMVLANHHEKIITDFILFFTLP